MATGERVLVVGLGSVGGVVAASLAGQPGVALTALVRRAAQARALSEQGLAVSGGAAGERAAPARVVSALDEEDVFDFILLATRAPQVQTAASELLPSLAEDGAFVCLQNGLCEDRVAAVAGPERVLGAVVAWGAETRADGVYRINAPGELRLGRMDGRADPRLERLAELLGHVSAARVTPNLAGARWSKLAMNAAGSALSTISGVPLGQAVKRRVVRQLSMEIFTELVLVSRALHVTLEPVAKGVDLNFFALVNAQGERRGRLACELRLPLSFAVGMRYRKVKSSMLRALERGQDPGIEMLNGEIVQRGEALGIPTPVNAEVVRAVQDALAGEAELGPALVDRVALRSGLRSRW